MKNIISVLFFSSLFALPRFSVEESSSCLNCHVNPTGSGMRNDHGTNVYNLDELTIRKWISKGNKDYCEAQLKMAVTYNKDIRNYSKSASTWENILDNSRQGICEENYTYYETHAYVLAKVEDFIPGSSTLYDIWKPHNGSMDISFDKYISLCPIMGQDCSEGENKLRLRILRAICNLMKETKWLYNNEVDSKITDPLRELNAMLYDRSLKYAELLGYQDKGSSMECIEENKID